jgi:DNA-binding NarL/FixJ family response regulator
MQARDNSGPAARVRVALVEQFAMVAETFEVAMRPMCTAIPVLVDPDWPRATIASSVLSVGPDIALLHLDNAVGDRDLPIEQLAAGGVVTVVLTDRRDDGRLGEFLRRGAEAALSTELGLRRMVNVVSRVAARESAMEPDEFNRLRESARAPRTTSGQTARDIVARLSVREGEVLRHLMSGQTPTQIARESVVSEATVRTQVRSILTKMNVGSQLSAVAIGYAAGWLPEGTETLLRSVRVS